MNPSVEVVRHFNRFVTRQLGALDEHFLRRDRPLALARLLWEVGTEGSEVVMLRSRLGIDAGQLSRMLRALEAEGLVVTTPTAADGRVRLVQLTEEGRRERALLDERSNELASDVLAPLDSEQEAELLAAMRSVERLLTLALVTVEQVDPASPDARRCLRAYIGELRRRAPERQFDPRQGSTAEPHELRAPNGAFLVAYLDGQAVGCGAVKHDPDGCTDIKRMWVSETARGRGIGRRLLGCLEDVARSHGSHTVRLETNDVLSEALGLYRSSGYEETAAFNDESFADRWFVKSLKTPTSTTGSTSGPNPDCEHAARSAR
jgi:DNA-binding MarR family transcriptional regulator/GNAT superfamily N-acetyltransferase